MLASLRRAVLAAVPVVMFRLGFHHIWRLVPRPVRRAIVDRLAPMPKLARTARPEAALAPYYVLGFAKSHASFGWALKGTLDAMRAEGLAPIVIDVAAQFGAEHEGAETRPDFDIHSMKAIAPGPGTLVLHINPHQVPFALSGLSEDRLAGKYIIGAFIWELEVVPTAWQPALDLVDEIWTPSRFCVHAFEKAVPDTPVCLMPYHLEVPATTAPDRSRFGLPEDRFLVLVAANVRSGNARKNWSGAGAAFSRAFGDMAPPADGVPLPHLVMKLHDAHLADDRVDDMAGTLAAFEADPLVTPLTGDYTDAEMWSLIASCDCILSLHRAEGYGLLMKQGLMLKKRVIATGWSAVEDFMPGDPNARLIDHSLVPVRDPEGLYEENAETRWAEPDVDHAAALLREAYADWLAARKAG